MNGKQANEIGAKVDAMHKQLQRIKEQIEASRPLIMEIAEQSELEATRKLYDEYIGLITDHVFIGQMSEHIPERSEETTVAFIVLISALRLAEAYIDTYARSFNRDLMTAQAMTAQVSDQIQ